MGWFLKRNKSGSSGKRKPTRGASGKRRGAKTGGAWNPTAAWRLAIVAAWIGGICSAAIGGYHGRLWLIDHVGEIRAHDRTATAHEPAVRLELASIPAWFGEARADRLCRETAERLLSSGPIEGQNGSTGLPRLTADPLDRAGLAAVRDELERSGWIDVVRRVVRRSGDRMIAFVEFHEPVALVESAAGYHLVAIETHGDAARVIRLPGTYAYHEVSGMGLLPVTGAAYPPPPAPGEVWRGDDVAAGVALAVRLAREPFADQVRQVDVANYGGRRDRARAHLMLKTARGAVFWGKAPGREDPLEPSAEAKIAALRQLDERFGSIDNGGLRVDVQRADRVVFPGREPGSGRVD